MAMKSATIYLLLLWACAVDGNISVEDHLGRSVSLDRPANRIVALAPHIVENLYSAGAGRKIVGAVEYCDYPESAKKLPRVGAISAYSLEAIVDLEPDLVVVWHSGRGGKIMDRLVQLGLTVYASDPHTLTDVAKSIRDYGRLTGNSEIAAQAAKTFEKTLRRLREKYAQLIPVSTFYQIWNDPLQTLNGQHIVSKVIELCGGTNVFAGEIALAPKISVESLLVRNPEVIVASGAADEKPRWLDNWQKWPAIHAVKRDNLYFVPPDLMLRHTMRILEGAGILCEHLQSARAK